MSSRTLFVSDTHWGHRAALDSRLRLNRPFATIEEHYEALIARWNAAVGPRDVVWHLGDFRYRCPEDHARAIFARLNGRQRFLVRGNHDRIAARLTWDDIFDVARVLVPLPDGTVQGLWCSHWAYRVWPRQNRGDIHPYGHSHGRLPGTAASTDVGVDCFEFRPVTLDVIRVRLAEDALREGGES